MRAFPLRCGLHTRRRLAALSLLLAAALPPVVSAQARPDPAALIAAQKEAMAPLAYMDGVWRGPAWTILASGEKHNITQTERIGPFLDGSVKVIEGRGYDGTSPTLRSGSRRVRLLPPFGRETPNAASG